MTTATTTDPTDFPCCEQGAIPLGEIRGTLNNGLRRAMPPIQEAAQIAHRDPGHAGRLDMCSERLCRVLSEAGAY
jgi:hypothetical protein